MIYDIVLERTMTKQMFIEADSEEEALRKAEWGHPMAFEEKGWIPMLFSTFGEAMGFIVRNCIRGEVVAVNVTIEEEQND